MSFNKTLIYVDPINNNNKFYRVVVDGSQMIVTYGRVGSAGVRKVSNFYSNDQAEREAAKVVRAKNKKGYEETQVTNDDEVSITSDKEDLRKVALASAVSGDTNAVNSVVEDVISRLVDMNAHNIIEASGGKLSVSTTGIVTSALGVVTLDAVKDASKLLKELSKMKSTDANYSQKLGAYLTLIPQKVASRNWVDSFLGSKEAVKAQERLLADIESSMKFAMTQKKDAEKAAEAQKNEEETPVIPFAHKLSLLEDKKEFDRIAKFVKDSANIHHRGAFNMKLKNVYVIENSAEADAAWEAKREAVGNVRELWHGTGPINILSILKKGLFVPKTSGSGIHIAGRMFGSGIYLASSSTKSLNYSRGSWTGQNYRGSVFMFLADVVMGSEFRPYQNKVSHYEIPDAARTRKNKRGKPFNSIKVTGGRDGVLNDEMIVWELDQISLKYLCEFE